MGVSGIDAQTETPPGSPRRLDMLLSRIAELEAQVAARDQLLAIAAHELRNPIHAIGLQIGVAGKMASERGDRAIGERLENRNGAHLLVSGLDKRVELHNRELRRQI
jgi:signal transduction histidine kinase